MLMELEFTAEPFSELARAEGYRRIFG